MIHTIPTHFDQSAPLPIPHCFGFPDYTDDNVYDLIVPEDFSLNEGDKVGLTRQGQSAYRDEQVVKRIVERRPAMGDWSNQEVHKSPHFIRFTSVPKPVAKKK
jgi:hypothetical protein